MLYAIKLGPIETDEGRVHAYVGIHEDGHLASPVITHRDKDALRELAADAPPGAKLLCEKRLARVGSAFGFAAAEMPPWVPMPRAALAAVLALGPDVLAADPDALHLLFHAANEFWRARPWRYWTDNDSIEVALTGAVDEKLEGALMGAGGMEYGVALYRKPGALARIARNVDRGRLQEARREDTLAVTFDDEPRFAIAALRHAYGLARLPIPMKIERGRIARPDGRELAILGGTLRLLAAVTLRHPEASLVVDGGDEQIEIALTMPSMAS